MCKLLEDYVFETQILFFGHAKKLSSGYYHKITHTKVGQDSNHDKVHQNCVTYHPFSQSIDTYYHAFYFLTSHMS
jgi:hypothetical protein